LAVVRAVYRRQRLIADERAGQIVVRNLVKVFSPQAAVALQMLADGLHKTRSSGAPASRRRAERLLRDPLQGDLRIMGLSGSGNRR